MADMICHMPNRYYACEHGKESCELVLQKIVLSCKLVICVDNVLQTLFCVTPRIDESYHIVKRRI